MTIKKNGKLGETTTADHGGRGAALDIVSKFEPTILCDIRSWNCTTFPGRAHVLRELVSVPGYTQARSAQSHVQLRDLFPPPPASPAFARCPAHAPAHPVVGRLRPSPRFCAEQCVLDHNRSREWLGGRLRSTSVVWAAPYAAAGQTQAQVGGSSSADPPGRCPSARESSASAPEPRRRFSTTAPPPCLKGPAHRLGAGVLAFLKSKTTANATTKKLYYSINFRIWVAKPCKTAKFFKNGQCHRSVFGAKSAENFLLSINDVPEAWELYSRAGSITRLCSGKNSSKSELLVLHQGNPVRGAFCARHRIARAAQAAPGPHQARTRPAPGPHQARTRPAPGPHQAPIQLRPGARSDFRLCFSKPFAHFSAQRGDKAVTSGDMLGGLEFAAFPARKRKTEQSGRLEPAFHRKPANLEARASHLQSDTKNGLFGLNRFKRFFAPKNFSGDKLGGLTDSGDKAVTSRQDRFCDKKRRFG